GASGSPTPSPTRSRACCATFTGSSAGSRSWPSPPSRRGSRSAPTAGAAGRNAIVGVGDPVASNERKPWHAIFRLLERDERVFAVLLAVVMVGGLATLGLVPLRPRHRIDLYWLVFWFAASQVGIFGLVTVNPRAT